MLITCRSIASRICSRAAAFDQGKSSTTARMWAYRSFDLPLNAFDFTVSRHREGPQEILSNFSGTLMAAPTMNHYHLITGH